MAKQKISLKHSVDAVKELYLIIVGLGLTQTLWSLSPGLKDILVRPALPIFYIITLAGYLSIVFQFTLGTFNVLTSISEHENSSDNQWTKSILVISMCFLASAVLIVLMGKHINPSGFYGYCIFLALLFLVDIIGLVGSHRPWDKEKYFKDNACYWDWFFFKSLYLAFWGINGNYRKYLISYYKMGFELKNIKDCPEKASQDKRIIKQTHYWWCSANVWTVIIVLVISVILYELQPIYPQFLTQSLQRFTGNDIPFQYVAFLFLSIILIYSAYLNFTKNSIYFFGKKSVEQSQPFQGMHKGVAISFCNNFKRLYRYFRKKLNF